ncbi:MAG: hypothetical protein VXW02_10335, partial [Verrucomicrobiota bacterium]|nr:hypothetical protein [Verrucomicrobiota bacterium]
MNKALIIRGIWLALSCSFVVKELMTKKVPNLRTFTAKSFIKILLGAILLIPLSSEAQIRTYEVIFNGSSPVLDGVRGPGEWDNASEAATDFKLLRTGG